MDKSERKRCQIITLWMTWLCQAYLQYIKQFKFIQNYKKINFTPYAICDKFYAYGLDLNQSETFHISRIIVM